jgi:hypothetical protein
MDQECSNTTANTPARERLGAVEMFEIAVEGGHKVHFDAYQDFSHVLLKSGSQVGGAEGGYLLIRFDVDDEGFTVVHVDPPGGWWADEGKAPADMVYRGAEYLRILSDKLERFEALIDGVDQ